jgi:hypothetical protein
LEVRNVEGVDASGAAFDRGEKQQGIINLSPAATKTSVSQKTFTGLF